MRPNLFIVGAPKCGTTALHHYLNEHPDISMVTAKEIHYFAKDLQRESDQLHNRKVAFLTRTKKEYLKLFSGMNTKYRGEASPTYFYSKEAAKNIYNFNKDAKIIIIIREPIELMYSWFCQNRRHANENINDFETAIKKKKERRKGKKIPPAAFTPKATIYKDIADYKKNISRFTTLFKNVKVLVFEEFKEDNQQALDELSDFLNIDYFYPEKKVVNKSRAIKFKTLNQLFWSLKLLPTSIKKRVPKKIKNKILRFVQNKLLEDKKQKALNYKTQKKLMREFKDDVVKLNKYLNKEKLIETNLVKLWGYDKI